MSTSPPERTPALLAALGMAVCACALEISMLFSALPALVKTFGDPGTVFWTVTIHYLAAASSVALSGRLGDLYGRRRVLMIVLSVALCGSLLSYFSPSLLGIIVGRGIQGLSAAAIPLAFGLVREQLPPARVPSSIGIVATLAPVTGGIGALLGGVLVDQAGWRTIFAVSAGWMALTLVCLALFVPGRATSSHRRIDILGGVLLPPAIAALLLAIEGAKHWGWLHAGTLGLAAASLALLAFWYRHEAAHPDPLIDVRLLSHRQIGLANLGMALFGLGALQNTQLLSLLLQQPVESGAGLGVSATQVGALFTPFIIVNLVGGPLSGRIAAKHGGRPAALLGMALAAIGWIALALWHDTLWFVMAMAYLQMLGIAMLFAALPNLVVEIAPPDRTSEATGVLSVTRQFAASIGTQVLAFTLATSTVSVPGATAHYPTDDAFTLAMAYIAVVSIVAVFIATRLPKRAAARATS